MPVPLETAQRQSDQIPAGSSTERILSFHVGLGSFRVDSKRPMVLTLLLERSSGY